MSLQSVFAALAAALGPIRAMQHFHDDERKALDDAIAHLKTAEANVGELIAADVKAAVDAILPGIREDVAAGLKTYTDQVEGVVKGLSSRIDQVGETVESLGTAITEVANAVTGTTTIPLVLDEDLPPPNGEADAEPDLPEIEPEPADDLPPPSDAQDDPEPTPPSDGLDGQPVDDLPLADDEIKSQATEPVTDTQGEQQPDTIPGGSTFTQGQGDPAAETPSTADSTGGASTSAPDADMGNATLSAEDGLGDSLEPA